MKVVLIALFLVLAGCTSTTKVSSNSNTMDIIERAAESAPAGVFGEYELNIQAAGKVRKTVFLNTQKDYRDQRSITVVLHPKILADLESRYGEAPLTFFVDKKIMVKGYAKRTRIDFFTEGKASGKYYYQTHIRVDEPSNIQLVAD